VRLITGAEDLYTWTVLPQRRHLFKKHLSKHSIGAYKELCREVGKSFETALAGINSSDEDKSAELEVVFCHRIAEGL
jgi:hypothetical protein